MEGDWTASAGRVRVLFGDCRERLLELPSKSVHCVVTSPPYWGVRDYGSEMGLEESPAAYVRNLLLAMRAVRRVLRDDGTCWLNLGDSYATRSPAGWQGKNTKAPDRRGLAHPRMKKAADGIKTKDLVGIPWRCALALQRDGWWIRSEVIWHKPAPMPESVEDRPTRAHEHLFLLTRSADYFYNADAIRTPVVDKTRSTYGSVRATRGGAGDDRLSPKAERLGASLPKRTPKTASDGTVLGANKRSVWTISSPPYDGDHTSTFPEALVEPCILAGCPVDGTVLDPFVGSGTTLKVADRLGRSSIGIEMNRECLPDIEKRMAGLQRDLLASVGVA